MYGTMSREVLERRRAEMLREAELNRLKKALTSESQETRHLPVGLDLGVGADEGRRSPPQVLPDAEELRLERAGRKS